MASTSSRDVTKSTTDRQHTGKVDVDAGLSTGLVPVADWRHIACCSFMTSTTGGIAYWNGAMMNGFVPGILACLTGYLSFLLLIMCMAELTSTIPLSGGSFGFVRVSVGPQLACIAGVMETLTYVIGAEVYLVVIYKALALVHSTNNAVNMVLVFLTYAAITGFLCLGSRLLWRITIPVGILFLSVELAAWLICLTTPGLDLSEWSTRVGPVLRGPSAYFSMLITGLYTYVGVESTALSAEDALEPRRNMPIGMLVGYLITGTTLLITILIFSAAPPGLSYISAEYFVMLPLMETRFGSDSGRIVTGVIALVETTISVAYVTHVIGRIVYALARGGLFPKSLSALHDSAPTYAIIAGAIATYAIFAVFTCLGELQQVVLVSTLMCTFTALWNYLLIFISFIVLRLRFSQLPRKFYSPLGLPGGFVGLVIIVATLVSTFAYTPSAVAMPAFIIVFGISLLVASYWLLYAQFHADVSPEELVALSAKLTAAKMLQSGLGYTYLMEHCEREHNTENLHCVKMIQEFFENPSAADFVDLYAQHLGPQSREPANIPSVMSAKATEIHNQLQALAQDMSMPVSARSNSLQLSQRSTLFAFVAQLSTGSEASASEGSARHTGSFEQLYSPLKRGQCDRHPEVKRLLTEQIPPLLHKVEKELMSLLEKDILPRFKATRYFVEYVQKEPVLLKELSRPVNVLDVIRDRLQQPHNKIYPAA